VKKYGYNLHVLDVWSPQLAYILGLALTDGTVHKSLTRVTFYSSDTQMLEVVKTVFESNRPIIPHSHPDKSPIATKQMYVFHLDSKWAAERFCELGATPNKSYTGEYPRVPQAVWWHYFRGILDGDGNIFFSRKAGLRVTIAGNKNCITGLQSDLSEMFGLRAETKHLYTDRVKLLFLYGVNAEKALLQTYRNSENLRLERKFHQWVEWNDYGKLCDVSIRSSQGQKLCSSCRVIRNRLMNRRSDHYRRNSVWLPLRDLCKPEESHLLIEQLDRYEDGARLYGHRRAKRQTEKIVQELEAEHAVS
jgi:hypothetical protein